MATQGLQLPIQVQISNLQEIAQQLKQFASSNVLADSLGGKKIDAELAKVLRTLGQIELKSKSAFKTDADFSGLEKDVTKVELSLEKVQTTIANLQFKDLKIPQESVAQIEALNAKIQELKAGFASFKAGQRDKLLANASFTTSMQNAFGTGEASKILAKNYDDIYNAVKDGMDRVNRELQLQKNRFEENSRIVTQNTEGKANFTAWGALEWLQKAFEQLPKDHAKMNEQQKVMADFMKINPETNAFDGWQRGAVGLNGFYKHLIDSLHLDPSQVAEIRRRIQDAMKEFNRTAQEELQKIATDPAEGARIFGNTKGMSFDSFLASRNQYEQQVKARDTAQVNQGKAAADVEAMRAAWEGLKPVQDEVAAQQAVLAQALKEPESALQSLQDAIRQSVTTAPELGAAYGQATQRLNELRQAANAGKAQLANLDQTLNKLQGLSNFVTRYIGIYAIIRRVSTAIRNAFSNIKELDKTITNIAVVTNMSQKDLWAKIGEYTSMAQQYGVATKDVYTVSQIFYQQGLKTSQVMSLTTETLKMAKISGMDYSQAANAMTVAIRAFKIEMTDAQSVTDTYSALAAKFAVSSAEIANAMEKTASSAANVGMSLQSTSAFISVMEQTTREGAQNIGSALKSIISRYGEMKASPNTLLDVDGEEVAFNKVDTALKSIGISIKDASGQFRDFDDVILELASKWDTLDNNTQRYVATVMAGNRQQSRFIALVSNYDELKRAMSVADNAENASIIQVGKTMDSLESKANQLKNAFSQIYLDLHVEDGLKSMYDWLTRILKTIGRLGVLKGALPTLANLIGFGTGTKSLINQAKASITEKQKKVNLNTSEAEQKAKELEDILTRPVTKKVTVDDSAVTASNAATTATLTAQQLASDPGVASAMSTQLINNLSMANPKMTDAAIQSSLYTALAEGKLNSDAGIRSYMNEEMHMDPDTQIGYDTFTALQGLAAAAQNAATNLNTAGTSAGSASTELTNLGNTSTQVVTGEQTKLSAAAQAAQADLEKATSAKEAAYEDVQKAIAEQRAAVAVDAETQARLQDAVTSKATTYANAVAKEQEARASYNNIVAKEQEAQGSRNSGQAEDEEAHSSRNAAAADEEEASASRNASGSSHQYSTTLMKGIGVAAGVSRIIGTLITAAGAAHQDKSTDNVETSKLLTGIGNGISMAGTGASMGMAFGPWGALIGGVAGLLLGGLPAFIDGLHMDTKERLALQKDEAEASKNESLKQQSTVLDLTSSIENIKALKKTMYDSEEDMQAYKDAMNSMAEAYPELVTAYDSAGNAIIDLVAAEKKLMEARHQSSSAAVDAAKDELEVIKTKRKLIIESTDAKYLPAEVKSTADMNLGEQIVDRFDPNGVYWSSRGQNKYMRYIPGLGDIESQKKWFEDVKEELGLTGMTASQFFGWDTMSPTATVEQRAQQGKQRIEALLEQYDIKLAAATKSYEKALNQEALDAKLLTSSLTTATQLKISENSIFTSMVGSRANYYSELPQYENKTDNEIRMMAAERIMNWAATLTPTLLDEFINDTSDLTTYLSAGDIISKYKIYDPDAAAGLVEAFIDANKDNCEYILKTIYKTDTKGNLIVSDGSYVFNDALTGLAKLNKELTTDIANNFIENNLKIISKYSTFFTEELAKINKLADKGYVTLATNRLNVLHQLSEQLAGLDTTQQNDLFGTITGIDFTSLESISDAYSKVQAYAKKNGLENDSNIQAMLTTLSNAMTDLVYNITTIASTLTTQIEKAAKEIDSILSTNKSGLSLDKALSELKEINAAAEEGVSYSFNELFSYDAVLGKYVYTRLGLVKAIKRQEKRMAETRTQLQTSAEMYKTLAEEVPEWKFTPTLTDTSLHTTKTTDINTLPMTLENLQKYTGLALTTSADATGDMLQGQQEAIELMEQWQQEYLTTIPEAERTYAGYADFMNAKRAEFLKNFMATHNMALNITEYDPEGYQTAFFSDAVLKSFRENGTLSDYFMGNYIRGSKYHYPTSYVLSEDIETPIEGLQEVKTQLPLTGTNLLAHSIKGYSLDSTVAELYKQWTDEYCELYEEDARTYESYVEFMEQRRIDYIMSYVPEDQKDSVRAKIEADEFGGFSNAHNASAVRKAAGIGRMDTRSQQIEGAFALHFEVPDEIPYETTYVIPEGVDLSTEPMFSTSDELIAFAQDRYSNPELAGYFEQLAVKFFETYTKSEDWTWEKFIEFLKSETGEMEKEAAQALEEEEAYLANTKNQIYQAIDWSKLVLKTDNTGRNTMMLRMLGEELGLYIYDEATQVGSWIEGYSDEAWDKVLEAYLTDLYAIKDEKGNILNAEELPGLVANAKNLIMGQFKSSASDQVSTAINEILNGGGQVLSETTLALVEGREDLTIEDGILKAGTNFIETAKALYNDYASNLLSLSDKNTTYSAILNKKFEQPNQAITALTSAASMDMSTLTDTFTKFGLELAQWYNGESWQNGLEAAMSTNAFGKTTIVDWDMFLATTGISLSDEILGSFEYQNAYSSYVDGMITLDTQMVELIKKNYDNAFSTITEWKPVNISKLAQNETLIEKLTKNNAAIIDGGQLIVKDAVEYAKNTSELFIALSSADTGWLYENTGWTKADIAKNWKNAQTVITEVQDTWTALAENISSLNTDQISTLVEKGDFDLNKLTTDAFTKIGDTYVLKLEKYRTYLIEAIGGTGATYEGLNPNQQKKVDEAYNKAEQAIVNKINGLDWAKILDGTATAADQDTFVKGLQESLASLGIALSTYYNADGTLNLNMLIGALQDLNTEASKEIIKNITNNIATTRDNVLTAIETAMSHTMSGTKNLSDIEKFIESYNKLNPEETIDISAFSYDSDLQQFTLSGSVLKKYIESQKKVLQELGLSNAAIDAYIKDQTETLLQQEMDITSLLEAKDSKEQKDAASKLKTAIQNYLDLGNVIYADLSLTPERVEEIKKQINELYAKDEAATSMEEASGYYQAAEELERSLREMTANEIVNVLYKGGAEAAEILARIKGDEVTSEELSAVYNAGVNRIKAAEEALSSGVGTTLTGLAADIASTTDGIETAELPDGSVVITAVTDMTQAYVNLYQQMAATAEATTADLNSMFAKVLTAKDQGNIDAIQTLSDAMGMDYDSLGKLLAQYGKDEWSSLEYMMLHQYTAGIEALGNGKVRIVDWKKFSSQMNWEVGGEAYMEAYNAYNDSLIELDRKVGKQIVEEIKNVSEAKTGDRINITYLTEAIEGGENAINAALLGMGAEVKDGILTIKNGAQIGNIIATLANMAKNSGQAITSELAELADAVEEFIDNIVNLIKNGIGGSLKNSEANTLKEWAKTYAGIENLDFTRTAEGLQLSEQSAIALYAALKKVDSVKASLVFDELSESLQKNNDNFKSVSALMGHIRKVSEGVYKADGKTSKARLQQYEAELAVAKEILAVRSTQEDDSFNFMSNKIPAAQNNPLNYAKNWTQALQTIRDAFKVKKGGKTGFIDYEDWYNIATEINNMAAVTGKEIKLGSLTFKGDLESASAAIQAGAESLTTVDTGDLKVNLASVGIGIKSGADAMTDGITEGIQGVAKAQVAALDGIIAMLELIVAMEQLGDIDTDSNGIDLSDLFEVTYDENGTKQVNYEKFSADYERWVNGIKDKINKDSANYNEDLAKAVNGIKIDGHALVDMLDWTPGQFTDPANANVAKAYAAMLDAFNKAALSGNYDLDNIQQSVLQVLAESGFEDTVTLDIGDMTYVISAGTMTTIDWTDTDTDKILTELAAKEKTDKTNARAKLTTWIQKYGSGEPLGEAELHYVLQVKKKITMEDGKVTSVVVGGKTYNTTNSSQAELDAAVNAAVLEDFGYDVTDWKVKEGTEHTVEVETKIGNKTVKVESENGQVRLVSADGKRKYKNQAEFLEGEYHQWLVENTGKSKEGMYKSQEEWQWGEYRVATKVDPKFVIESTGETVTPDSDPNLRSQLTDILNGGHDAVAKYFNEHATDNKNGTYTVDIGGYQFTFTGGENAITNFENAIGEQLGIDVGLSNTISTAIANAFANEDVSKSVSDAMSKGIQDALGTGAGEGADVPIPTLAIKPEALTINADGVTPQFGSGETVTNEIAVPEITIKPTKVTVSAENLNGALPEGTTITVETLNALVAALTLVQAWTTPDESGLTKPTTLSEGIDALTATVKALALSQGWELPDESGLTKPTTLSEQIAQLEATVNALKLKDAETRTTDESGISKPTDLTNAIETLGAIVTQLKLTCDGKTAPDESGITLPTELAKQIASLTAQVAQIAFSPTEAAAAEAKAGPSQTDLGIQSVYTSENSIDFIQNVKLTYNVETDEDAASIMNTRSALYGQVQSNRYGEHWFNTSTLDYTHALESYGLNHTYGQGWSITEGSDLANYVESLRSIVSAGQQLGEVDLSNLEALKDLNFDSTTAKNLTDLYNAATVNAVDAETNMATVKELIEGGIDVSSLENVAGALERIAAAVASLAGAPWSSIADGINSLNTPTPTTDGNGGSSGEESVTIDTSGFEDAAKSADEASASAGTFGTSAQQAAEGENAAASAAQEEASAQQQLTSAEITAGQSAGVATPQMNNMASAEARTGGSAASAAASIQALANAIRSIPGSKTHDIKLNISASVSSPDAKGNVSLTSITPRNLTAISFAKGNARAGGQSTLMGELGPELVVSNGRYFVVGQGGAEFVDLAPDAIVFNHKQTAQLLSNGKAGRGKPVTNEDKAISWAKGNANGGPAMASASAALAALKQLRAQWKALEALSAKDLAGKAGGGGGGGGKNAAFIKQLERWYNLLQEIATLEQKITYEQAKRSKIQSSFNKSGKEYFQSQKDSLKYLEAEVQRHQQLADEQQEYFNQRRAELNKQSAFSELYTFDENGQIKYKEGKFAELSKRFGGDSTTGKPNYSVKEQYDWLKAQGYGYAMEYNENGEKIEIKDDKDEAGMKSAIEAFWAKIDSDKSEMQELHDSIEEHKKAVLEKQQAQNEILKEIEDNQLAVENKVLKALEDAEKRKIDELQKQKDAIEEGNENLIKGLTEQLDIERRMYQSQESQAELESKRRKLAILQRSGGSAAEINSLQKEIDNDAREEYFNKQQEQIDTIQQASDNELEKLQQQIDLMTETLEYQKEHGLLWAQVYEVMARSPEEIADYIKANDSSYWGKSPADLARSMRDDLFEAEKWAAFAAEGVDIKDYVAKIADEVTKKEESSKPASGGDSGGTGSSGTDSGGDNQPTQSEKPKPTVKSTSGYKYNDSFHWKVQTMSDGTTRTIGKEAHDKKSDYRPGVSYNWCTKCGWRKNINTSTGKEIKYASGGMNYDTGLVQLDGTKTRPEAVLNAEQTQVLRDNILSSKPDSLISLLKSYNEAYHGLSSTAYDSISDNSNSVVIEHAEVNMHVAKMDNSYDAAKAGDDVMREILHIASKTPVRNRIS